MSLLDRLKTLQSSGEGDTFLKNLNTEELECLFAKAKEKPFKKGETLSYKDEEGEAMFAVLEGSVKIVDVSASGKETILNFIQPGEVVGEIAVLDRLPRTADAIAASSGAAAVLARRDVLAALTETPPLALKIMTLLCAKIRMASAMAADGWTLDLKSRLARSLVRLGTHYGTEDAEGSVEIQLRLSQSELGNYAGLSRENVNRQLSTWRQKDIVQLSNGKFVIKDMDQLMDIADQVE